MHLAQKQWNLIGACWRCYLENYENTLFTFKFHVENYLNQLLLCNMVHFMWCQCKAIAQNWSTLMLKIKEKIKMCSWSWEVIVNSRMNRHLMYMQYYGMG